MKQKLIPHSMRFLSNWFRALNLRSSFRFVMSLLVAAVAIAIMANTTLTQMKLANIDATRTFKLIDSQKDDKGALKLETVAPLVQWQFGIPLEYRKLHLLSYNLTAFLSGALLLYVINKRRD